MIYPNELIVTNTANVEGETITEYMGIVSGEAIIGANLIKDIFASIRNVVGGRTESYEKVLRQAREEALMELQDRALEMGADAVVGVRFDYEALGESSGMLMVIVDGTAVKLA